MKKRQAQVAPPLSIEDEMIELANQILSERLKIKQATDNLKEKEETLKTYMIASNQATVGVMALETSAGAIDWKSDLKGKNLDLVLSELKSALNAQYLNVEINKKEVYVNIKSDMALFGLLKQKGLDIIQKEGTTKLKEIKVN